MDLRLLLPVISLNFTVVSKLLLLYSTTDKTSTLKMKSFSTVRVTQRGSQRCGQQRTTRDAVESAWVNCRIRGGHNLGAEPAANSSPIFFFKAKKTQTGSRRKISSLTLSFSSFYFHFKPPFQ